MDIGRQGCISLPETRIGSTCRDIFNAGKDHSAWSQFVAFLCSGTCESLSGAAVGRRRDLITSP